MAGGIDMYIYRGKVQKGVLQRRGGKKNGRLKVGAGLRSVSAGKVMEGW